MTEALALLFPHKYITDFEEDNLRRSASNHNFPPKQLSTMLRRPTQIIRSFRNHKGTVYLVAHQEKTGGTSIFSTRIAKAQSDIIVVSGVIVKNDGHWLSDYPDWTAILHRIPESSLIVGGFHYDDCVQKFIKIAKAEGREAKISPILTDLYYSFSCWPRILKKSYGTLPMPMCVELDEFLKIKKRYAQQARAILGLP